MGNSRINIILGLDLNKFDKSMKMAQRRLTRFSRQMQKTGSTLTQNMTVPIAGLGAVASKVFIGFEQEMAKVKAISGATGEEFKLLSDNAKELGRSTKFTASEVAGLQLNLSKLGFSSKEILQSTESILNLSWATGEDLAESARVAAGTLRGFGLEASEMGRVSDVMAASFSGSALDLEKFSLSMGKIAPVANALGLSLENTTAMLGTLMDANVEASTAGTSLRMMMLKATNDGFNFNTALNNIKNSSNQAEEALKYFDKRTVATAIILANNTSKVKKLTSEFEGASGKAKSMADTMKNTLGNTLQELKSALEGVAIELGSVLKPMIEKLANSIKGFAERWSGLDESTKKTIVTVGLLVAAIGPVMLIISKLTLVVRGLVVAFGFLTSPIGLIIAGITALGAVAAYVADNWDAFKERFKNIWITIKNFLLKSLAVMLENIKRFAGMFGVDILGDTISDITEGIEVVSEATTEFKTIGETFDSIKGKISGFFSSFSSGMSEVAETTAKATEEIQKFNGVVVKPIKSKTIKTNEPDNSGLEALKNRTQKAGLAAAEALDTFNEKQLYMLELANNVGSAVGNVFYEMGNNIVDSLNIANEGFQSFVKKLASTVLELISILLSNSLANAISGATQSGTATGPAAVITTPAFIATAVGGVLSAFAAIPKFAEGGLAYGPTLGLMGEYSGARTNPEVIAPLDKLSAMMGGKEVEVFGVIRGEDIWLSNERHSRNLNRIR